MSCQHAEREYGRVLYGSDGLYHVEERCVACKAKTRGGWVGRAELDGLGLVRETLPIFRDLRTSAAAASQPSMFTEDNDDAS